MIHFEAVQKGGFDFVSPDESGPTALNLTNSSRPCHPERNEVESKGKLRNFLDSLYQLNDFFNSLLDARIILRSPFFSEGLRIVDRSAKYSTGDPA